MLQLSIVFLCLCDFLEFEESKKKNKQLNKTVANRAKIKQIKTYICVLFTTKIKWFLYNNISIGKTLEAPIIKIPKLNLITKKLRHMHLPSVKWTNLQFNRLHIDLLKSWHTGRVSSNYIEFYVFVYSHKQTTWELCVWQNANVVKKPIGKIINTFFFGLLFKEFLESWVGLVFGGYTYFSFRWKKREEKKRKEKEQN